MRSASYMTHGLKLISTFDLRRLAQLLRVFTNCLHKHGVLSTTNTFGRVVPVVVASPSVDAVSHTLSGIRQDPTMSDIQLINRRFKKPELIAEGISLSSSCLCIMC
jgi:hypothetical protein